MKGTMIVEANAKYVMVNGCPLLSLKGMQYTIMYKFKANVEKFFSLTMLQENVHMEIANTKGDAIQITGCPRDQLSIQFYYKGLRD